MIGNFCQENEFMTPDYAEWLVANNAVLRQLLLGWIQLEFDF